MPNPALLAMATHVALHAAGTGARLVALNPLDSTSWLSSLGAFGVFLVLFAETGLLIGFFLPGDSLLFTAGLLCTTGASSGLHLSLTTVLPAAVAGALLGAQAGYLIGLKAGPPLLDRPDRPRLHDSPQCGTRPLRATDAMSLQPSNLPRAYRCAVPEAVQEVLILAGRSNAFKSMTG